jgi:hypothetical protein
MLTRLPFRVPHVIHLTVLSLLITLFGTSVVQAHEPATEMMTAARRLLASLDEKQRSKAQFEFKSDRRDFWHFVPDKFIKPDGRRYGLPMGEMSPEQRLLAHGLLSTGLSHRGYRQSVTIMMLESILREIEEEDRNRDPQLYYVSIFGDPVGNRTWAWRFEGHHLSINFTLVGGRLFSVTPSFFGTNPARVQQGPHAGLEVLAVEQDLARELVKSLSPEQAKAAIIDTKAPRDILTSQDRKVNKGVFFPPQGIAFEQLTNEQQKMLLDLIREYAQKYRPEILKQIGERIPIAGERPMYFAWAGGLERGEGHYYRVQSPHFLFEYDNTQNDANHVHAVWRQFDGDFGEDLLHKHYQDSSHRS